MPITCPIEFGPLDTESFGKLDYGVMEYAFASQNELGRLADETIYQGDFARRLATVGFQVLREVPILVAFQTFSKAYLLDVVVNDRAIYEIKAVAKLTREHTSQLLNYLLLLDVQRGKLVNFRSATVESQFVNCPVSRSERQSFILNASRWQGSPVLLRYVVEMLRDWGTGLELPLYVEAITHQLGGESLVHALLPMQRDGVLLG
ncbi:MAG: GxxExxY protein, partial [Pirellulaceae bacterium]